MPLKKDESLTRMTTLVRTIDLVKVNVGTEMTTHTRHTVKLRLIDLKHHID